MPGNDLFLQTIEAVCASGLDSDRLPQALELTSLMLGAAGATLEIFDKSVQRHSAFHAVGVPTAARTPYVEHFATLNPRSICIAKKRRPRGLGSSDHGRRQHET